MRITYGQRIGAEGAHVEVSTETDGAPLESALMLRETVHEIRDRFQELHEEEESAEEIDLDDVLEETDMSESGRTDMLDYANRLLR